MSASKHIGSLSMAGAIQSVFKTPDQWAIRDQVAWYVSRCEMAGFCSTDDMRRQCAERYLAGKRKVTHPGTAKRKKQEKATKKILANIPFDLLEAVAQAKQTTAWAQYQSGNAKAINSVIGPLIKRFNVPVNVIKTIFGTNE